MVRSRFFGRRTVVAQFGPFVRWVVWVPWWWVGGGLSWLRWSGRWGRFCSWWVGGSLSLWWLVVVSLVLWLVVLVSLVVSRC